MNPFAVVETGGKQIRVEPSQVIDIERLRLGDTPQDVVLDKVLMVGQGESLEIGTPYVKGASVICEFLGEQKGPKVIIFKMRRRKNYRRKKGHRQVLTRVKVKEIQFRG